jgi:hypothetical protein
MSEKVDLDSRGVEAVLKSSDVKRAVEKAANDVADKVRQQGIRVVGIPGEIELPVKVTIQETDRARASVALAHPSGKAVQAKHGALTKAAAQAGLRVKG